MMKQYIAPFVWTQKWKKVINESDIDDGFESLYSNIISNIQRSLGNGSGWIFDSVIDHSINISKYNPFSGSSHIKLSKEVWLIFKVLMIMNALNGV